MKSRASDAVLNYYYDKLKYYYNCIKRRLNITVESSSSEMTSSMSSPLSVPSKIELLKELTQAQQKGESFVYYQSESKALEELVGIMKSN